jgi:hypothetical protein
MFILISQQQPGNLAENPALWFQERLGFPATTLLAAIEVPGSCSSASYTGYILRRL